MSRKGLFATESDDLAEGDVATAEIGTGEETGAVAELEVETVEGIDELSADAGDIEVAADAGEQLEEVADGMQEAVDSGEGLTEVAAEAYRMALAAICKPLGANPSRFFQLYAKESFAAESARLSNTSFALEGVKEFMTDLYKRIKAALERLWKKVKTFWDKHISNLGRAQKSLTAMKARVKKAGKLKGVPHLDNMPGSLADSFQPSGELTPTEVNAVITAHQKLNDGVGRFATAIARLVEGYTKIAEGGKNLKLADKSEISPFPKVTGLVGGYALEVIIETDNKDEDSTAVTFTVNREVESDASPDTSKGMLIPSKEVLGKMLTDAEAELKKSITIRKNQEKMEKEMVQALQDMHSASQNDKIKNPKIVRKHMIELSRVSVFTVKFFSTMASENIRLTRAVLGYTAYCLKSYN